MRCFMEHNTIKILVIDDNIDNLITLKALLYESFPDVIVFTTTSGANGIDIAQKESPDVILLDVVMPEMDGFEVCTKLKSNNKLNSIPVVFVTALKGDKLSRIRALEVGAEAFLAKPIDESELKAQVRAMIKIKQAHNEKQNETIRLKKLVAEQTKELKAREFFLLEAQKVANLGTYSLDVKTGKWESSEVLNQIFGIDTDFEKTLDNWVSIIHPDWRETINDYFYNEVIGSRRKFDKEYKIIQQSTLKDRWVHGLGTLKYNNDGEIIEMIGTVTDISDRKDAIEKIKESESNLKRGELVANLGNWKMDLNSKVLYASEGAQNIYGITKSEITLDELKKIRLPEYALLMDDALKNLISNKKPYDLEFKIKRESDGEIIDVHSKGEYDTTTNTIFGVIQDITEQKKTEKELRENKEKYRRVINTMNEGLVTVDNDDVIQFVNDRMLQITGYSSDELVGKYVHNVLFPKEEQNKIIEKIELRKQGISERYESKIRKKDGELIFVSISGAPTKDAEGNVIGSIGVVTDISLRKKQEEMIQLLSQAVEQSPVSIMITDTKANIQYVNATFFEVTGYSSDEVMGINPRILSSGHTSNTEYKKLWETITQGKNWKGVFHNKKKNGTLYWESAFISPVKNKEGRITNYLTVKEDITERKKTIEDLMISEARLLDSQSTAKLGSWETDLATLDVIWSKELYRVFGIDLNTFKSSHQSFLSFVHPDDRIIVDEAFIASFNNNNYNTIQHRIITPIGEIKHVEEKWRIVFDTEKKPIKAIGSCQDVTERVLASFEREKIISDIIIRNQDLEQFSYIVSHNLRAPVANILGLSSLLKDNLVGSDEKEEVINGISFSVNKLDEVIRDLNHVLEVKNQINEQLIKVNFANILTDVADSITKLIQENKVIIQSNFREIESIFTIKSYLYSIFYNLLSNSIKYKHNDKPPIIQIKSFKKENHIELVFTDNGIGFDLNKKKKEVFGLYKRFHNHVDGKGMGLFMVKTQVEAIGGKIHVESEINNGTTFKIILPNH